MRNASLQRKTTETDIALSLNLDGVGKTDIHTGCGFLDHMLTLFAKHGQFDIAVQCAGDVNVDFHHTTEDIGIVLGQAFRQALSDCRGIRRYGSMLLPMDEALLLVSLDISGRAYLSCELIFQAEKIGDFDTELVQEFLLAFSRSLQLTLHVRQMAGSNAHHIAEATFKALGRALSQAVCIDAAHAQEIPSSKGVLF